MENKKVSNHGKEIESIKQLVHNIDRKHSVSDKEGEFLYNIAKNCKGERVIVEIGSWKGVSTIWLGRGSKAGNNVKIYAIDPHTGSLIHRKMYGKVWTFEEFKKNIKTANIDDIIVPVVKTSEKAAKDWNNGFIEFLWIDGDHSYDMVKLDFNLWFSYLVNGGIIALHDTISFSGPRKIVINNIYKSRNFIDVGLIDSVTFARKVMQNTFKDRLKNRSVLLLRHRGALFLRYFYNFFLKCKLFLPKPIKKLLKKIVDKYIKNKNKNF